MPLCMKQREQKVLTRQISVAYLNKDMELSTKTFADIAVSMASQITFYWQVHDS